MKCAICGCIEGPWYITNDLRRICDLCIENIAFTLKLDKVDLIDRLEQERDAIQFIRQACRECRHSA